MSQAIQDAAGSVLTDKCAEGYPGRRYSGGCKFVDKAESLVIERAKALFDCGFAARQSDCHRIDSIPDPGDPRMSASARGSNKAACSHVPGNLTLMTSQMNQLAVRRHAAARECRARRTTEDTSRKCMWTWCRRRSDRDFPLHLDSSVRPQASSALRRQQRFRCTEARSPKLRWSCQRSRRLGRSACHCRSHSQA